MRESFASWPAQTLQGRPILFRAAFFFLFAPLTPHHSTFSLASLPAAVLPSQLTFFYAAKRATTGNNETMNAAALKSDYFGGVVARVAVAATSPSVVPFPAGVIYITFCPFLLAALSLAQRAGFMRWRGGRSLCPQSADHFNLPSSSACRCPFCVHLPLCFLNLSLWEGI